MPEIHRILGDKAIPRWTLDALLQIDNLLDEGAPVRYRILDGPVKQPVSMRKLGINQKGKEVANEV